ncbi:BlaI/MecI/CopY family transcriptional regulator [Candidatus Uhrbacteria bacterium]|nr:BlaI/MecI/CopY family transcriptional regulator [Candidatus Uhrbacteria bacterium]
MNPFKNNGTLGELESEIMEIVWQMPNCSVRAVLSRLKRKRAAAYTTVMTVMFRLFEKGILKRELDASGAYLYRPVQGKQDFLAAASKKIISRLLKEYGDVVVAQFMDVIDGMKTKKINTLRKKLKKIK